MTYRIGDVFTGTVSSVTDFGVFVELDDLYIDGLVHVTNMGNDFWVFDVNFRTLTGERSGKVYRLGSSVEVVVTRADLEKARIDFDFVGVKQEKRQGNRKSNGKSNGKRSKSKSKSGKHKKNKQDKR